MGQGGAGTLHDVGTSTSVGSGRVRGVRGAARRARQQRIRLELVGARSARKLFSSVVHLAVVVGFRNPGPTLATVHSRPRRPGFDRVHAFAGHRAPRVALPRRVAPPPPDSHRIPPLPSLLRKKIPDMDPSEASARRVRVLADHVSPRAPTHDALVPNPTAASKPRFTVAVLGAAGGIGQPLSLLLKQSPS